MSEELVIDRDAQLGTLSLHPLVIINISDQYTRKKVQSKGKDPNPQVLGMLMGMQKGRNVEIYNSFETVYTIVEGKIEIDQQFLEEKLGQFAQPFPLYDVLGWYTTKGGVTPEDFEINSQFMEINESPLVLVLDPTKAVPTAKKLPIDIYEQEIRLVDGVSQTFFARLEYKIETGESERVAVDHIAHVKPVVEGDSELAAHLEGVQNAIQMLNFRVKNIQKFVDATIKGEIPKDHHLLRQISSMANMLPAIDSEAWKDEFITEYNDTLLVTLLACITKGANQASTLTEKFHLAYDKQQAGKRAMW